MRIGRGLGVALVLGAVALAGCGGSESETAPPPPQQAADDAPEMRKVTPESLEQGFTIVCEDMAGEASESSPVHVSCNWNGWSMSDGAWRMTRRADGRWELHVPHGSHGDRLKFRLVQSGRVEAKRDDGAPIEGRLLWMVADEPGRAPEMLVRVYRWTDGG